MPSGPEVGEAELTEIAKQKEGTTLTCQFCGKKYHYTAEEILEDAINEQLRQGEEDADDVIDPVCGMTVDPRTAAAKRVWQGRTVHFCNPHCAEVFDEGPANYIDKD